MKIPLTFVAIIIIILTCLTIDFNIRGWEKKDHVIFHDIHYYYGYLPAKFIFHDIKVEKGNYQNSDGEFLLWLVKLDNGKYIFKMTCGIAYLYAPFFFAAHFVAGFFGYNTNGFSEPYKFFLLLSAIFYLYVGLDFVRKTLLKLNFNETHTAISVFILGMATNLLCYSSQQAPMSNVYSFTIISIFVYCTVMYHETQKTKYFISVSLLLGLISLIRPTDILVGLFFMLYGINSWDQIKNAKIKVLYVFILTIGILIPWIPQFLYWKEVTGSYFADGYQNEHFFFNNSMIHHGLIGFRKGWLIYTPVMAFAIMGFFFMNGTDKKAKNALIILLIAYCYVTFSWWCWWYGGSFGQRVMINIYSMMAIPLASFIRKMSDNKKAIQLTVAAIVAFFIWLNIFQTFQFEKGSLHFEGMNQKLYFKQFGKLEKIPDYDKYIDYINSDEAKAGNR